MRFTFRPMAAAAFNRRAVTVYERAGFRADTRPHAAHERRRVGVAEMVCDTGSSDLSTSH